MRLRPPDQLQPVGGTPVAVIEALGAGTPVAAYPLPGVRAALAARRRRNDGLRLDSRRLSRPRSPASWTKRETAMCSPRRLASGSTSPAPAARSKPSTRACFDPPASRRLVPLPAAAERRCEPLARDVEVPAPRRVRGGDPRPPPPSARWPTTRNGTSIERTTSSGPTGSGEDCGGRRCPSRRGARRGHPAAGGRHEAVRSRSLRGHLAAGRKRADAKAARSETIRLHRDDVPVRIRASRSAPRPEPPSGLGCGLARRLDLLHMKAHVPDGTCSGGSNRALRAARRRERRTEQACVPASGGGRPPRPPEVSTPRMSPTSWDPELAVR